MDTIGVKCLFFKNYLTSQKDEALESICEEISKEANFLLNENKASRIISTGYSIVLIRSIYLLPSAIITYEKKHTP